MNIQKIIGEFLFNMRQTHGLPPRETMKIIIEQTYKNRGLKISKEKTDLIIENLGVNKI